MKTQPGPRARLLHARRQLLDSLCESCYHIPCGRMSPNRDKRDAMSTVNEIKAAIEALREEEYAQLRQWFSERDWEKWDKQLEADSESGRLDFLIQEALDEKARGSLKDL
jgi:hypothetical protein